MKRFLAIMLALAMAAAMAGCHQHHWEEATCETPKICNDCDATEGEPLGHTPGTEVITAVDTDALTITLDTICGRCGEVMETKQAPTGIAPADSALVISAEEWYNCLSTNIQLLGAGQTLYPYPAESQDGTYIQGVVTMSQMMTVFTFHDAQGNAITTQQQEDRGIVHNIRVDAQFTNDNAREFFMLLMVVLMNNNAELAPEDANTLTAQIMSGNQVSDNGFTYAMEIVSAADHTVCVSITAE